RLALAPDHRERAGLRDVVEVMTHVVAIRAGLAKAGDCAIHQPGIARRKHLVADTQALGDTGAELLDHDVGALRQAQENLASRRALEIKPDRFLVAPQRVVYAEAAWTPFGLARGRGLVGTPTGGRAGLLDLDNVGAEVAENHRAMRAGRKLGQIDDFDSAERCD